MRDRREYNRNWHLAHKDSENAGSREYYAKNTDKCKALVKNWRKSNPEKVVEFDRKYNSAHPEKLAQWAKKFKMSEKQKFINAYGGRCQCCGEDHFEFLTCEHLIPGEGIAHRKAGIHGAQMYKAIRLEGYPKDKYTVLCMNCNFARNHGKTCPHEAERLRNKFDCEGLRAIAG